MLRRPWLAALLLAIAVAGGPGFAGLEAYEHAHRTTPGHGHRIHFERRGGQDHDDACGAWLLSAPVRAPLQPTGMVRLAPVRVRRPPSPPDPHRVRTPPLLPLSRAPPVAV